MCKISSIFDYYYSHYSIIPHLSIDFVYTYIDSLYMCVEGMSLLKGNASKWEHCLPSMVHPRSTKTRFGSVLSWIELKKLSLLFTFAVSVFVSVFALVFIHPLSNSFHVMVSYIIYLLVSVYMLDVICCRRYDIFVYKEYFLVFSTLMLFLLWYEANQHRHNYVCAVKLICKIFGHECWTLLQ